MSAELSRVIEAFSKFLDTKFVKKLSIESIGELKNLPLNAYKFINEDEAKYLEEYLAISDVLDASKLNDLKQKIDFQKKIKSLIKKYPALEKKVSKACTISSIISNIKDSSFEKKQQKITVVGLDNAGKTAIITRFGGKLGIKSLANIKPTKGVARKVVDSEDLELMIWDMGGQKEYRDKYLKNPELYFFQLDLLVYVIDVQDSERFESSFEYFENILEIFANLEETPYILIFIHKYDPDLKADPAIQLNVEFLKENLKELFDNREPELEFEIYLTSIYSLISNEPKFSKFIKDVMKVSTSVTDPTVRRVEGLGQILEDTMNAVIRLSESISLQLSALEHRIVAIEGGSYTAPKSGLPMEVPQTSTRLPSEGTRSHVLSELKDLFAKKKKLDI
jgi:small GTP-binding protein